LPVTGPVEAPPATGLAPARTRRLRTRRGRRCGRGPGARLGQRGAHRLRHALPPDQPLVPVEARVRDRLLAREGRMSRPKQLTLDRILETWLGGIVVSCQAPEGSPLRQPSIMAAMAEAGVLAGAVGIRANGQA